VRVCELAKFDKKNHNLMSRSRGIHVKGKKKEKRKEKKNRGKRVALIDCFGKNMDPLPPEKHACLSQSG
jgi:hypothetical protein